MSDNLLEVVFWSCGGGSTIAARGAETFRLDIAESTCGAGATGDSVKTGARFISLTFISGGGATTEVGNAGSFALESELALTARGIVGCGRDHATILGRGASWSNFNCGGATTVWVRLSTSGGTEMIACVACSGSPFFGERS
jgi:hypothetical protein